MPVQATVMAGVLACAQGRIRSADRDYLGATLPPNATLEGCTYDSVMPNLPASSQQPGSFGPNGRTHLRCAPT